MLNGIKRLFALIIWVTLILNTQAQTSPLYTLHGLEGPDAPDVLLSSQGMNIKIDIENPSISNNFNEMFAIVDTSIHNADSVFRFQGYIVYQVLDSTINLLDNLFDTSKVRIVAQSDIQDGLDTLTNHYFDTIANSCDSSIMVTGNNLGIQHSYLINIDAFSGNEFELSKVYCYYVVAYASNTNKLGVNCNKPWSYLIGKKNSSGSGINASCIFFNVTSIYENNIVSNVKAYPNPANEIVNIEINSAERLQADIVITDILGSSIKTINQQVQKGNNKLIWETNNIPSGIYLVNVMGNSSLQTMKVLINK